MTVTGWWGKFEAHTDPESGESLWDVRFLSDVVKLEAHVCHNCTEHHFNELIQFNPQLTVREKRKLDYEAWKKKNPDQLPLKGLIKTALGGIRYVHCDICGEECFDKHLNFKSSVQNEDKTYQCADICEKCTIKNLIPIIPFQKVN